MKYATKNNLGKSKNTRKTKAKTTASTVGRICRLDEAGQKRFGNSERPTEISSDKSITNGFLKCTFLPKLKENNAQKLASDEQNLTQIQRKNTKLESDFYQSFSQMAVHYRLNTMTTRHLGYPYNIALALDDIQKQLKNKVRDWEEIRLIEEKGKTYFVSEERYNTGAILYYIPIVPLYQLSKNPKRKQAVQLLQSVYSYLYHIAKVPYYRKQDSYLFWMYEMASEWITSDDENDETPIYFSEIKQAELSGYNIKLHLCCSVPHLQSKFFLFLLSIGFLPNPLLYFSVVFECHLKPKQYCKDNPNVLLSLYSIYNVPPFEKRIDKNRFLIWYFSFEFELNFVRLMPIFEHYFLLILEEKYILENHW
jgi:hypothetical protein